MKKKQYFGNERGALAGLFIAVAAVAMIPICIVIYNEFFGNADSFDAVRRNDNFYSSIMVGLGTTDEIITSLDTAIAAGAPHCVADFAVKENPGGADDDTTMPLLAEAPDGCVSDIAAVRAEIRSFSGSDPSSLRDYRVVMPSNNAGSREMFISPKQQSVEVTSPVEVIDEQSDLLTCFTGDTLVAVDVRDGQYLSVPIKYLRSGDVILGVMDDIEAAAKLAAPRLVSKEKENLLASFSKSLKKVKIKNLLIHDEAPDQVVRLSVAGGYLLTNKIHPFFVINNGWMNVKHIKEGLQVISADGESYPILAAQGLSRIETLYNLEVEGHTYFVIPNGSNKPIWVHNEMMGKNGNPDL